MHARRRLRWIATAVVLFVVMSFAVSFAAHAAPYPVHINATGANGVTRTTNPGLDCPAGPGSYRHYFIDSSLPGGVVSSLAASLVFRRSNPGLDREKLLNGIAHMQILLFWPAFLSDAIPIWLTGLPNHGEHPDHIP